ncbi:MAG: hypothetical protein JWM11_3259 [Planctomycetaceae bacterium]|nr:hypothetical protein [Planctomycetaceae bacterium]
MRISIGIICLLIYALLGSADRPSSGAEGAVQKQKKKGNPSVKEVFAPYQAEVLAAQKIADAELVPDNEKTDAARDLNVLNVVLSDLLSKDRKKMVFLRKNDKTGEDELDFSSHPDSQRVTVKDLLGSSVSPAPDAESWAKLSKLQITAALEGMGSLVCRCKANTDFDSLTALNSKVRMRKGEEVDSNDVAFHLVTAHRPGYSESKNIAVVNVSYFWSLHPAEAIYVLEKNEEKWTIIFCQHIYYA